MDPTLFATLRIQWTAGSSFAARDAASGPLRVVISESLANALWPSQRAVGRRLRLDLFNGITPEVIGVVRDIHLMDPRTPVRPIAYLADARFPSETRDVLIRTSGDPASIVPAMRVVLSDLDPSVPLSRAAPLTELVDGALASDRFTALLLSAFAILALSLGAIGVFGVISNDVSRRRREMAIRMALGARRGAVVRLVLKQALARAFWGIGFGMALALLFARSMQSLLFGVAPNDAASLVSVALLLCGVTTVATLVPTLQATRSSLGWLREG